MRCIIIIHCTDYLEMVFLQQFYICLFEYIHSIQLVSITFDKKKDQFIRRYRNHTRVYSSNPRDYQSRSVYLFVINYHWPRYDSVSFIEHDIYESFALNYPHDFDLVIIGPRGNNTLLVFNNGLPKGGYYSYHSMRIILDTFTPEEGYKYAGYFLVNDDSCLQPTLLSREDHGKAMRESAFTFHRSNGWWNKKINLNHVNFSVAAMESISEINRDKNLSMICKLNVTHLKDGWGDFFYFPSKDRELFMRLEDIFWRNKAFLEDVVPIIMQCLHAELIDDCNHGKMLNRESCSHLHPVKFSRPRERTICLNRIKNITLLEKPDNSY